MTRSARGRDGASQLNRMALAVGVVGAALLGLAVYDVVIEGADSFETPLLAADAVALAVLAVLLRRQHKLLRGLVADLKTRADQLEEAQRISNVGSFEIDLETMDVWMSPEMYRMTGADPSSPADYESLRAGVHPDDERRGAEEVEQALLRGEPWDYEYRFLHADGGYRWMRAQGRGTGNNRVVGTVQDITARKETEDALHRALEREREAAERLRMLDETRSALLTAVAHHVRTPLTSIVGFTDLLVSRDLEADRKADVKNRLLDNVDRLKALFDNLADVQRAGRELLGLRKQAADVGRLVEDAVARFRFTSDREVDVRAEAVEIEVDTASVIRIVQNLLENVDRHTPAGAPVRVEVSRTETGAAVVVADRGPGMPETMREQAFEPFRQGDDVPAHAPGLGVGLTVVRRLVGLHGGSVRVDDRPGGGASFRIELPRAAAPGIPEVVDRLLRVARRHLDMELAYFSRITDSEQTVVRAEGNLRFPGIEPGASIRLEDTYCTRMLTGRISPAVPDTATEPAVASLEVTSRAGIGAYVGVPVVRRDGELVGTLCCISRDAVEPPTDDDLLVLNMLAEIIAVGLDEIPG